MLRTILNIGVGLSMLFGTGASAFAAMRSEHAFQGFLQQPTQQSQANQEAVQSRERTRLQVNIPATNSTTPLQDQDRDRVHQQDRLHSQDGDQIRQQDQLHTMTHDQLCDQDQLQTSSRTQLKSRANAQSGVPAGEGKGRP